MKTIRYFVVLVIGVSFLVSCEKFPDGGLVKKADERVEGNWSMSGYLRDGDNEFGLIQISSYTEEFRSGGLYFRSYIKADQTQVDEEGTWEIQGDNLTVKLNGISSIEDFSDANSTLSYSSITIIRMKKDEFWYEFENGGNLHLFKMTR